MECPFRHDGKHSTFGIKKPVTLISELLFYLYLMATGTQLIFWGYFFSRLAFYKPPKTERNGDAPVSVIISARNEAENLRKNLPRFLGQNYRSFEIIVVNDHSVDETEEVLLEFQKKKSEITPR